MAAKDREIELVKRQSQRELELVKKQLAEALRPKEPAKGEQGEFCKQGRLKRLMILAIIVGMLKKGEKQSDEKLQIPVLTLFCQEVLAVYYS